MRAWMIPWLLPVGIVAEVIVLAVAPPWASGLVLAALLFVALPFVVRTYRREQPDLRLPSWLPGGRRPR